MGMNFDQLRIFRAVAECRSFTKAAELMYISHSTTSRSVAALEESLGVRLLIRDNRSVRLTPAGEILYREGGRLLQLTEDVESAVKNAGLGRTGKLTVAGTEPHCRAVEQGCRDFCRLYPEVLLGLYGRSAGELRVQVESGAADVGLLPAFSLPEDMTDFACLDAAEDAFCLVVPKGHPLAARSRAALEDLAGETLVVLEDEASLSPALRQALETAAPGLRRCAVPTEDSLFLQVRSGNGVAIVPGMAAERRREGCAAAALDAPEADCRLVLLWRKDNLNPSLPLFLETVKKVLEQKD